MSFACNSRRGKPQQQQRDPAAFVLLPHQEQPLAAALDVVDVALAGGDGAGILGIKSVGDQGFLELAQLLLQAFGEQLLVDAGGGGLAGAWGGQAPRQP